MAKYVDGFVIAIPKKKLNHYRDISKKAGKVWMDHGALQYVECVLEDMIDVGVPFKKLLKLKSSETVIFSWITYKSRAQRDRVNEKVMQDPRLDAMMKNEKSPYDVKRLSVAGFETLVDY